MSFISCGAPFRGMTVCSVLPYPGALTANLLTTEFTVKIPSSSVTTTLLFQVTKAPFTGFPVKKSMTFPVAYAMAWTGVKNRRKPNNMINALHLLLIGIFLPPQCPCQGRRECVASFPVRHKKTGKNHHVVI